MPAAVLFKQHSLLCLFAYSNILLFILNLSPHTHTYFTHTSTSTHLLLSHFDIYFAIRLNKLQHHILLLHYSTTKIPLSFWLLAIVSTSSTSIQTSLHTPSTNPFSLHNFLLLTFCSTQQFTSACHPNPLITSYHPLHCSSTSIHSATCQKVNL